MNLQGISHSDTLRMMLVLLFALLLPAPRALLSQSRSSVTEAQPCITAAGGTSTARDSKKSRARNRKVETRDATSACIELRFSALDIQEYLQSYVRSKQWRIAEELTSEDSWTFSRELSKDELLRVTKMDPNVTDVDWSGGKAVVQVNTAELVDGFTRTTIHTSFRGFGQSTDHVAMPKAWWLMDSNQSLEDSLISALENHFHPSH